MSEKPKVVHMKKFGALTGETPQEMHRRVAWGGRRCPCGGPAAIRIKVLAKVTDLTEKAPTVIAAIAASNKDNPGALPVIPSKYGPLLKTTDMVFCDLCRRAAEKAAADGPSWAIVEIDRGPDPTNRVVVGVS